MYMWDEKTNLAYIYNAENINVQYMKSLIPKGAKSTFDENWVIDIRPLFRLVPVFEQKYKPKFWEQL